MPEKNNEITTNTSKTSELALLTIRSTWKKTDKWMYVSNGAITPITGTLPRHEAVEPMAEEINSAIIRVRLPRRKTKIYIKQNIKNI